jgi:hypothetical protein
MSENTRPKQEQKKAIEQTKKGELISPAKLDKVDEIIKKANDLGLGSVLDDLRSADMRPSRRR